MPKSKKPVSQTVEAREGSKVKDVIQIGGDVVNSIIINGEQIFTGEYSYLRQDYIKPDSVFTRVALENFTGRDWLFDEIDSFIQKNKNGYFVLEAKAGLGKTTFLAQMVKKWKCIHHFVELSPGKEGLSAGLKSIIAQLMLAWTIQPSEKVMLGRAPRADYLQEFLFEVARIRDEKKPNEKIIIVVDALDEAGTPEGLNVLGLPKTLPDNVFFIVSQRPVEIRLDVERRVVFRLKPESENNLADMSLYLVNAAKWSGISKELRKQNYTDEYFISTLLNKCRGVWIYLHYITKEIEIGARRPLNLELLPHGVWQYYAQYWRRWRAEHRGQWNDIHLPLLATLAALQEETNLSLICKFAKVDESRVRHLVREKWSPFLTESSSNFRLYHASLQEFLDGRADHNDLLEQEIVFTQELAEATQQAHLKIANSFFDEWGGLENNLPLLLKREKREIHNSYGIRFIASHLEKGGTDGARTLNSLLAVEWSSSYLSSIEDDNTTSLPSQDNDKNTNDTDN